VEEIRKLRQNEEPVEGLRKPEDGERLVREDRLSRSVMIALVGKKPWKAKEYPPEKR